MYMSTVGLATSPVARPGLGSPRHGGGRFGESRGAQSDAPEVWVLVLGWGGVVISFGGGSLSLSGGPPLWGRQWNGGPGPKTGTLGHKNPAHGSHGA